MAVLVKTITSFSSAALSSRTPFPSVTDCARALSCGDPLQAAAAAVELMVALRSRNDFDPLTVIEMTQREGCGPWSYLHEESPRRFNRRHLCF